MGLRSLLPLSLLAVASVALGQPGQQSNPFAAPRASLHYALDRQYDLQNLLVETTVDYKGRTIQGRAVNTVAPLRNGLTDLRFMAGTALEIKGATVNGKTASF